MEDAVSTSEARDKAETKEYVSVLAEMEEKVSSRSAETKGKVETKSEKEKVSVAVAKEKVSHAAAKGGKAFMNLVHMAIPQSPKESKLNGSPKFVENGSNEATTDSPKSSLERKVKLSPNEPSSSPDSSLERKAKHVFDDSTPISPKSNAEKKSKLVSKIRKGLKVGKKSTDADNRSQLLDEKPVDPSPRVRSTDSIKIAYGHKPSTDPTSIAAQNREKLIERQEKLQDMNNQSEEMAEEAGNFASIAEQLAKQIENKKWYQL